MARREGDVDGEERALLDALRAADDELLVSVVQLALAKLYEHRLKDLARALEHAKGTAPAEGDEAAGRRQARLQRRLGAPI
jgi:hypothetical protein